MTYKEQAKRSIDEYIATTKGVKRAKGGVKGRKEAAWTEVKAFELLVNAAKAQEAKAMIKDSEKYTIIFFRDGTEKLIKGYSEADRFAAEHKEEILFTYTDHTGKEHLERRF